MTPLEAIKRMDEASFAMCSGSTHDPVDTCRAIDDFLNAVAEDNWDDPLVITLVLNAHSWWSVFQELSPSEEAVRIANNTFGTIVATLMNIYT